MSKPGIGVVHVVEAPPGQPGGPGAKGDRGPRGAAILSGSGAPTSLTGVDGDFYIDAAAQPRRLYGPRAGGAWPAGYQPLLTDMTPEMAVQAARAAAADASARAQAAFAEQAASTAVVSQATAVNSAKSAAAARDQAVAHAATTASDRAQTTYDRQQADHFRDLANQSATIARGVLGEVNTLHATIASQLFDWSFDSDPNIDNDWSVS